VKTLFHRLLRLMHIENIFRQDMHDFQDKPDINSCKINAFYGIKWKSITSVEQVQHSKGQVEIRNRERATKRCG
jgi:hypothetical protein